MGKCREKNVEIDFLYIFIGRMSEWSKEPDLRSGVLFTRGFEPHSAQRSILLLVYLGLYKGYRLDYQMIYTLEDL